MLKRKAFIAGAVLAMLVSTSLCNSLTTTGYAEGMAWREREESRDYSGLREDQALYIKNLEKAGKYDKAQRMRAYYRKQNNNRNDDQDGRNAFNRTHGRGNEDGSDGMAWREKRDQERREERARQLQERQERRERQRQEREARRNENKNGMDAFNRTHGR